MSLSVCLVGCGGIGAVHAQAYRKLSIEVNLSFCDKNKGSADNFAKEFSGNRIFVSLEDALSDKSIDLIDICLPHHLHEQTAIAVAESGKDLLMEKPLARNLAEADRIIASVKRSGIRFFHAESWRFYPAVEEAKKIIDSGGIGIPWYIEVRSGQLAIGWSGWRFNKKVTGGGVLIDRGIHQMDVLLNLGGKVQRVRAHISNNIVKQMQGEDAALLEISFKSGVIGRAFISWAVIGAPTIPWLIVHGTEGSLYSYTQRISDGGLFLSKMDQAGGVEESEVCATIKDENEMIDRELKYFVEECIIKNQPPEFGLTEAREALELVEASYISGRTRTEVKLPL